MIVCICKNVNSNTIKEKLNEGVTTIRGLHKETGAMGCCGKCKFKINALIQSHIPESSSSTLVAQTS
jgi:bacterioferritin-associated ferredoxin